MPAREENKMYDLDEYIRQVEPHKKEKGWAWQTAIGLQQVDGLTPSEYLLDTARQHIEGDITIEQASKLIDNYYKSRDVRDNVELNRTEEADKVSARITALIQDNSFSFTPGQITFIHKFLFDGIYQFAGKIRDYNITKKEWVLNGETVVYSSCNTIVDNINYDLREERDFSYSAIGVDDSIVHIARFCSNLWQIHPFGEGNTRTVAVFMIKYLKTLGFNVSNSVFANHSWYFRNALVRSNYTNIQNGVNEDISFLVNFFRALLLGENRDFRNRELHINWKNDSQSQQSANSVSQSAIQSAKFPPKCKNCTLEEIAVLNLIIKTPNITQKQLALEIGKSERTVKTITLNLSEKGIMRRVNGKRNGYWEIISDNS